MRIFCIKTSRRKPCHPTTTKTQLEAKNFTGLTGEQISGDLLTATIWSWFAATESHNRLSQNQANMIENQGLSYGLFHAIAQPVYSWGVIRKVTFPGVNMDIGHVRPIGYSKDNDPTSWIAYNKLRGQYMSALEHAIPERFFNDPTKCNAEGTTTPVLGLPVCPQGISAVKAIGLAASQGQKIYTITPEVYQNNPNIVNANLSAHSQSTKQAVQNALDIGHEVTIHEKPITQSGWTGAGYTTIDPATGAGGYMIDGGLNGGVLLAALFGGVGVYLMLLPVFLTFSPLILSLIALTLLGVLLLELNIALGENGSVSRNFLSNLAYGIIAVGLGALLFPGGAAAAAAIVGVIAIYNVLLMIALSFLNAIHASNKHLDKHAELVYA